VLQVADILRAHGPAYAQTHRLLPSQARVLADVVACRTAACGGQLFECDHCGYTHYAYHSCKNRHCPKCHGRQTQLWLERQHHLLLPCSYYLLTFTLPQGLRALAWGHQQALYGLLLSAAAAALQKLAWDPKCVGGQLAILAVLHTWTRALLYHPHAHLLVSAGGLSADGQHWMPAQNPAFLVPCFALSKIFRAKVCAGLKRLGLLDQLDPKLWEQKWVVHCQHAGRGPKVLDYLGRYVFRVAISNSRLEAFDRGQVGFRYRDNRTHQLQHVRLSAEEFIRRFLQHVLPKGFVKVRTYGLWHAHARRKLEEAPAQLSAPPQPASGDPPAPPTPPQAQPLPQRCPRCHVGALHWVACLLPQRTRAP
jgi:hypothetical protein